MAGLFVSIRVDFLIGRWWTGDFSPNLHWWKVTISMPGRSSRAWTRGIFHELAPVECSNANTPLIPSRYSITKRARLKRRFASRHLRLKRETEASRFQTWNWSKQVSGSSPPTPRLGGLTLHYKTRISDQGPRSMGLGMLYPILLVLLCDINRNSKMQESTTGHQNWSDNRESKFSTAGNITMRVHIDTPSPASFCQFCSAKLILMSTSQSRKGKARGQPRPLYNRMSQRVAVDALEDNTHQNLYDPYLEITLFPSWVLHNHGAERPRT